MAKQQKGQRPKGGGSMREKTPGVWELRVALDPDPVTGARRRVSRSFRGTKREAQKALAGLVVECDRERVGGDRTFGHLLDAWWERKSRERSPTTVAEYRRIIDRTWRPKLGDVPLDQLKAAHLQAVVDELHVGGMAAPSIERQLAVARGALRMAERLEWIPRSPHDRVLKPSDNRDAPDDPTAVELLAVLKAASVADPWLGLMLRTAAGFGCRRGELCGLRWMDLDLPAGMVTIRKNVVVVSVRDPANPKRQKRQVVVKDTKTGKKPTILIDADTVTLLRLWRARVEEIADSAGLKLRKEAFVFSRHPGGAEPLMPEWITRAFKSAADEVGVVAHLHQLRHLNASTMLAAGVPLAVASKRVGHSKPSTTTDMYGDVIFSDGQAKAAAAIGAMLAGVVPVLPGLPSGDGPAVLENGSDGREPEPGEDGAQAGAVVRGD